VGAQRPGSTATSNDDPHAGQSATASSTARGGQKCSRSARSRRPTGQSASSSDGSSSRRSALADARSRSARAAGVRARPASHSSRTVAGVSWFTSGWAPWAREPRDRAPPLTHGRRTRAHDFQSRMRRSRDNTSWHTSHPNT
jgi:hypothetical protein